MFAVCGDRDLPVGPLAGQVDAHAGYDCGLVLQAEGGEVQAAESRDKKHKGEIKTLSTGFRGVHSKCIVIHRFIKVKLYICKMLHTHKHLLSRGVHSLSIHHLTKIL